MNSSLKANTHLHPQSDRRERIRRSRTHCLLAGAIALAILLVWPAEAFSQLLKPISAHGALFGGGPKSGRSPDAIYMLCMGKTYRVVNDATEFVTIAKKRKRVALGFRREGADALLRAVRLEATAQGVELDKLTSPTTWCMDKGGENSESERATRPRYQSYQGMYYLFSSQGEADVSPSSEFSACQAKDDYSYTRYKGSAFRDDALAGIAMRGFEEVFHRVQQRPIMAVFLGPKGIIIVGRGEYAKFRLGETSAADLKIKLVPNAAVFEQIVQQDKLEREAVDKFAEDLWGGLE